MPESLVCYFERDPITVYGGEPSMPVTVPDDRNSERRARDEQIAAEPPLALPDLPPGLVPHLGAAHLGGSNGALDPMYRPLRKRSS